MPITQDEFMRLLNSNKNIIYKICHVYCAGENDKADLAQEISYHLWKSATSYNANYKFSTWMYRIALNTAISHYRKKKKDVLVTPLSDHHFNKEDTGLNDEKEEQIARLYRFIGELSVLDKAVILLYLEQRTYKEIAEIIGLSVTNVSTKINRLKERLKKSLLIKQRYNER